MNRNISQLDPKNVWEIFQEICNVPHPSKKETAIRQYLVEFGKKHQLETHESGVGNIVFRKGSTPGYEQCKMVTLQSHMDMVPAKSNTSTHNFETDPIAAYIDGDWVTADDTTLGSDNGIGLAMSLAVLASKELEHGPLEVLVTVDEETGMTGAFGLTGEELKGEVLLNLDSEDDDEASIGCAGGIDTNVKMTLTREAVPSGYTSMALTIKGLFSGHSGVDAHLGRINAIKELSNVLYILQNAFDIKLVNMTGGTLRNVIPAKCICDFIVKTEHVAELKTLIDTHRLGLQAEYGEVEEKMMFDVEETALAKTYIGESRQIILALSACFSGLSKINLKLLIPELSSNFGMIKTGDTEMQCTFLSRSPVDLSKRRIANSIAAAFELAGATVEQTGSYPGWQPDVNSDILKVVQKCYKKLFNEEIKVAATHGGLECGLIMDKYPNMEAASIGANIRFPHSINEKVSISSVQKNWELVKEVLKNIPKK